MREGKEASTCIERLYRGSFMLGGRKLKTVALFKRKGVKKKKKEIYNDVPDIGLQPKKGKTSTDHSGGKAIWVQGF